MINKRYVRSAMLIAFLAAFGSGRVALAAGEVEPNDPVSSAQVLTIGSDGTATVDGGILNTVSHRDVDFYSFPAKAGDVVNVSITTTLDSTAFYPFIVLFGPDGTNLLAMQGAGLVGTPIANLALPQTGTYVVGVTSDPAFFNDVNTLSSMTINDDSPYYNINGTYSLQISGVSAPVVAQPAPPPPVTTPSVQSIAIKIRPFSRDVILAFARDDRHFRRDRDFDALRHHFKGGIPVALLSSANFNALDTDPSSLKFGSTGTEDSLIRCNGHGFDVNGDRLPDLVCYFDFAKTDFQPGDVEGFVTGRTNSGTDFQGEGALKIYSGKPHGRPHDRQHHHNR